MSFTVTSIQMLGIVGIASAVGFLIGFFVSGGE